jgi:hypothetical protein
MISAGALVLLAAPQIAGRFTWEGYIHPDRPADVRIEITNPGPTITGRLVLQWASAAAIQGASSVRFRALEDRMGDLYVVPVLLPEGTTRVYHVSVEPKIYRSFSLWAFLLDDARPERDADVAGVEILHSAAHPSMPMLAVVGSRSPPTLRDAFECPPEDRSAAATIARVPEVELLPDRWHGYIALDALLWMDANPQAITGPEQARALEAWIAWGGTLIVAEPVAPLVRGTFLDELLPVEVLDADTTPNAADFAAALGASAPEGPFPFRKVRLRNGAETLYENAGAPLVVSKRHAAGRIVFLAFDPASAPFHQWSGMHALWRKIIETPSSPTGPARDPWTGYVVERMNQLVVGWARSFQ